MLCNSVMTIMRHMLVLNNNSILSIIIPIETSSGGKQLLTSFENASKAFFLIKVEPERLTS